MKNINVGLSVSILMAKHEVKMPQLEAGTGLSNSTLRNMKANASTGSIPNLVKVAHFFKLGVIEFLTEGIGSRDLDFGDKGVGDES